MTFSFLTEAVVLFSVPAVFWHVLIVRHAGGASVGELVWTGGLTLVLVFLAFALVRYGALGVPLPDMPWLPLLTVGSAAALAWVSGGRLLGTGAPQQLLIAVQLFRPIGMLFVLEDLRGTLPSSFAHRRAGAISPPGWWPPPS